MAARMTRPLPSDAAVHSFPVRSTRRGYEGATFNPRPAFAATPLDRFHPYGWYIWEDSSTMPPNDTPQTSDELGFDCIPSEVRSEPLYFRPEPVETGPVESGRVTMTIRFRYSRTPAGKRKLRLKVALQPEMVERRNPEAETYLRTHLVDAVSQPQDWDNLRAPSPPGWNEPPPVLPSRREQFRE